MVPGADSPEPVDSALALLDVHGDALAERCVRRMLEDPFWEERFGDRSLSVGRETGQDHVRYLREAIRGQRPYVFSNYAVWLRDAACARSLCTLHVERSLMALRDELHALDDRVFTTAIGWIDEAIRRLRYATGPGQQVERLCPIATEQVLHEDALGHADQWSHIVPVLCSYLADSVAGTRPQAFTEHVHWRLGYLRNRGIPVRDLMRVIDAMETVMDRAVQPMRDRILGTLHDARVVVMSAA